MLVAVAHGNRIEARILGFDGEDERSCPFRFFAQRVSGRPDGPLPRMECESVRVLRQAHLRILQFVEPALLLLTLDFRLMRRR